MALIKFYAYSNLIFEEKFNGKINMGKIEEIYTLIYIWNCEETPYADIVLSEIRYASFLSVTNRFVYC